MLPCSLERSKLVLATFRAVNFESLKVLNERVCKSSFDAEYWVGWGRRFKATYLWFGATSLDFACG